MYAHSQLSKSDIVKKRLAVFGVLLLVLACVLTVVGRNRASIQAQRPSPAAIQDTKKLDEIRNRPGIKQQQELIVQETYLNEEKSRIQTEKVQATAKYDSQIADVEKQLEQVRSEKTSFQ